MNRPFLEGARYTDGLTIRTVLEVDSDFGKGANRRIVYRDSRGRTKECSLATFRRWAKDRMN